MAASACPGQALSLLDCCCAYTLDRTRMHDRILVGRLPQAVTLFSALAELQRHRAPRIRAASKGHSRPGAEHTIGSENEKAPRKNRRKKSPPRLSPESNGGITSRRKQKQDVLSLVRDVDNAEDSSNESSVSPLAARYVEESVEKSATEGLGFRAHAVTNNLDPSDTNSKLKNKGKSLLRESTSRTVLAGQHRSHAGGNKTVSAKASEVNGVGTNCSTSEENPQMLPASEVEASEASTSRVNKRKPGPRRRRKRSDGLSEQDGSQLKPEMDTVPQQLTLEYDAKIGENVVDITECLASLSSVSSFHSIKDKVSDKGTNITMDTNDDISDKEVEKVIRDQAQTARVIKIDVKGSEGLQQGPKRSRRAPRTVKRSKSLQKQLSAEEDKEQDKDHRVSQPEQGMCTVQWLVETHLAVNQKLFLVGEHSHLGAWDPFMGIDFSLHEKAGKSNLWQAQRQMPFGTSSEYNYFIQVGDEKTNHIVWRPGPRLHFATPLEDSEDTEIIVKDALDFNIANKLPALVWEGLQNEIGFPTELKRFFGDQISLEEPSVFATLDCDTGEGDLEHKDEPELSVQDLVKEPKEEFQHVNHIVQVDDVQDDALRNDIDNATSEKPQLGESGIATIPLTPKLQKHIRKRVFPREEPWLMESMILLEKNIALRPLAANLVEREHDVELDDTQDRLMEKSAEKEEKLIEILINASKCTMERIAILENGKLVELLLKPVNSDINVGNVYLGIVKKLLPGMTGVFVDIGHSRAALLTITKNVYPFTFPPITNGNCADNQGDDVEDHSSGKKGVAVVESCQSDSKCNAAIEEDWETDTEDDEEDEEADAIIDIEELADAHNADASHEGEDGKRRGRKLLLVNDKRTRPITVNFGQRFTKWRKVEEGMRIIVQVKREPLGKKGPKVCAFPQLSSRFWVLSLGGRSTGVSKKISGSERKRLKDLAKLFKKPGFELTVRTEAAGQNQEDLEKDLARLLDTWKDIMEQAEAASIAAQNGQDGAVPVLLHRGMGQTLSIVRDFFAEKVQRMVVDTAQTYHEVMCYLQEVAPQLQNRVELYTGTTPIFDVFNLEDDIDKILNERVQLPNGAYLVIEETEALVTIDVNGGAGMLGKSMKSAAILEANLAAARQIAAELRLRDIGGIIVIDFIDMDEEEHETLVYEEMRKAIQSDRSIIFLSEISELGLMELTRRRVRPSVSFMISDPCTCCSGTGRVEALETTFSKIERAILRLVANHPENIHFDGRTWKKVLLRVDPVMFEFLTKKQRAAKLSSSLKIHIILKVGREMRRGSFELSELKLENEKQTSRTGGQQQQQQPRPSRRGVHVGAGGKKGAASRT